ncbi:MAG: ABC transporter permease [Treponema sp.]|nr:ABC transporter permease [Treponema sp.]
MIFFDMASYSVPLLLASMGALFSEYAGVLALFLDGLISFSAFLTFAFTTATGSAPLGILLSSLSSLLITFAFAFLIERFRANQFIAAMGLNLLFSALTSMFSFIFFGTRGVLTSEKFIFQPQSVKLAALISAIILISAAVLFLAKSRPGLYIRITGSDSAVLLQNGVNPRFMRILSWSIAAFYASFAGSFLAMRISSFVPNISSGRGWMALAAVFLGKKKPLRIVAAVLLFCCADFFSAYLQNILPAMPSSFFISFPYLIILLLVFFNRV